MGRYRGKTDRIEAIRAAWTTGTLRHRRIAPEGVSCSGILTMRRDGLRLQADPGVRPPAFDHVDSEAAARGFLVFVLHVAASVAQVLADLVERDAMPEAKGQMPS